MREYDLVVIGSGPGEQKAAIAAAKLGKTVAIIERDMMLGGVCTNTVSHYRELARGQIAGACHGMLKLLVSPDDLKLLGVHIVGTNATELVHIGQTTMSCGGTNS